MTDFPDRWHTLPYSSYSLHSPLLPVPSIHSQSESASPVLLFEAHIWTWHLHASSPLLLHAAPFFSAAPFLSLAPPCGPILLCCPILIPCSSMLPHSYPFFSMLPHIYPRSSMLPHSYLPLLHAAPYLSPLLIAAPFFFLAPQCCIIFVPTPSCCTIFILLIYATLFFLFLYLLCHAFGPGLILVTLCAALVWSWLLHAAPILIPCSAILMSAPPRGPALILVFLCCPCLILVPPGQTW